jgi:hypothetical protein
MNRPDFSRLGWTTYKPTEPEITDFAEALAVIAYIKSKL